MVEARVVVNGLVVVGETYIRRIFLEVPKLKPCTLRILVDAADQPQLAYPPRAHVHDME